MPTPAAGEPTSPQRTPAPASRRWSEAPAVRVLLGLGALAVAIAYWLAAGWLWHTTVPAGLRLPRLDSAAYFGAETLRRARDFSRWSEIASLGGAVVPLVVLFFYARRGAVLMRESAAGRIGTGMLLAMLGFALVWLAALPFAILELALERHYKLASASYPELLLGTFFGLGGRFIFVCLGVLIVMALAGWLRRLWWAAAAPVFAALALLQAWASPYLSTDTHSISGSQLAAATSRFAKQDGVGGVRVEVQEVHRFTSAPNAEAVGLAPVRKLILWDTLFLPGFSSRQREAVVAHELGHLKRDHNLKQVGWFALLALPLALLIARVTGRRGGMYQPAAVPVAIFALTVLQFAAMPIKNAVSRRYEAEADWIALQSTRDPASQTQLLEHLARASLADPSPPAWDYVLLEDHPTIMQRIAMSLAWRSR